MAKRKKGQKLTRRKPGLLASVEKRAERELEHELEAAMHHSHFRLRAIALLLLLTAANVLFYSTVLNAPSEMLVTGALLLNLLLLPIGFWVLFLHPMLAVKVVFLLSLLLLEIVAITRFGDGLSIALSALLDIGAVSFLWSGRFDDG